MGIDMGWTCAYGPWVLNVCIWSMGIDMEWMCAYGPCVLIWGGCVHMVSLHGY